jgi:hypothetical protein
MNENPRLRCHLARGREAREFISNLQKHFGADLCLVEGAMGKWWLAS